MTVVRGMQYTMHNMRNYLLKRQAWQLWEECSTVCIKLEELFFSILAGKLQKYPLFVNHTSFSKLKIKMRGDDHWLLLLYFAATTQFWKEIQITAWNLNQLQNMFCLPCITGLERWEGGKSRETSSLSLCCASQTNQHIFVYSHLTSLVHTMDTKRKIEQHN